MSEGLERYTARRARRQAVYKPIHVLYRRPSSGCEFFEVIEESGYYMVRCRVLGRLLISDAVIKCENYWKTCPFRRIGLQMMEES